MPIPDLCLKSVNQTRISLPTLEVEEPEMNDISCDQLPSSSTIDEDSETSGKAKVVTRREMIMALIARSVVEEEPEQDPLPQSGEAYNEVTHHQQAGTSVALEMRHLEGDSQDKSANDVVEEYKTRGYAGYNMKFATSIDDLPWKQSKVRCNLCSKIISKKSFNNHIRFAHLTNNRVKCDVCGKEVKKCSLNQHKLIHSNKGRAKKIPCNICGKLIQDGHLKKHKNIVHGHHSSRERVNCEHCGTNVFKEKLKEHKMIHVNEGRAKKMPCNICGKLVQERHLKKHMKIHSNRNKGTECNINHEAKGNVKLNEKKSNLIIKIMSCKICGMKVQKRCLKRHLKEHSQKE